MAKLDLETSGESEGYSDSFEIEESISLDPTESSTESDTNNAVISQLKKSLTIGAQMQPASVNNTKTHSETTAASPEFVKNFRPDICRNSVILDGGSGSVDLGRTIRSPVNIREWSAPRSGRNNAERPSSKFKRVAQNVHTMQSVVNTAKNFNDSLEVRDSVYSEWLARKSSVVNQEKKAKTLAKKMEEETKRKREIEIAQRSTKAVERWAASKEIELQKARKEKLRDMRKAKEQTKELEEKRQAAEVASKKWREEKTRKLASERRKSRNKEQEKIKMKEEEAAEKAQSATQAFDVWSKRKDEVVRMEKQKQKEHKQQLNQTKTEQERLRREEAKRAFEAWKGQKDDLLNKTKILYTYKENGKRRVHERAWCPARSIKHTYPMAKLTDTKVKSVDRRTTRSTSLEASYSSASFESTDVGSETDSSIVDEDSVSSGTGDQSSKGVKKTIQVCCQTLEYWCTCDRV